MFNRVLLKQAMTTMLIGTVVLGFSACTRMGKTTGGAGPAAPSYPMTQQQASPTTKTGGAAPTTKTKITTKNITQKHAPSKTWANNKQPIGKTAPKHKAITKTTTTKTKTY